MKTIALIDQHSGYYWGYAETNDVKKAARFVDHGIDGDRGQTYAECNRTDADSTYHGYDVSAVIDRMRVADGQDEAAIDLIVKQPYLGSVRRETTS